MTPAMKDDRESETEERDEQSAQTSEATVRHRGEGEGEGDGGSSGHSDEIECHSSAAAPEISTCTSGSSENWMVLSIAGDKPTPRLNHAAAVIGNKMIVVGGESGTGLLDDVQGFSLVLVQHKEKDFLVAFGGSKKEPSNQVEVLIMEKNESALRRRSVPNKGPASTLLEKHSAPTRLASQLNDCSQRLVDSVARQNLASAIEHGSGRKSLSESLIVDPSYPLPTSPFVNDLIMMKSTIQTSRRTRTLTKVLYLG
ncbi:Kelch-type beta propeller [Sesbania bispinosa]|nr:Kelch-type beta propeller [Sesbania bispinosa]